MPSPTLALLLLLVDPRGRAYAGPDAVPADDVPREAVPTETIAPRADAPEPVEDDGGETREINVGATTPPREDVDRSGSVVERRDLDERLARSAPDALRYEPGVYIQQTAHAQASPYVRGLTGQQTVMFFDGVRMNNSTFRQGPNQYFFTVDSRTIERLEVVRGSASTRYGSDALGGALLTTPREPTVREDGRRTVVHGRAITQTGTADGSYGARAEIDLGFAGKVGVLGGVGYRDVGQLRSGGPVTSPETGEPQRVPPLFEADGKTQRGTGFRELTADTRVVWEPAAHHRVTVGYYDYRQYDAPRTDKCPPPTAPQDECLTYLEQFRTLVYTAYQADDGPAPAQDVRVTLSYQRQHEERLFDRGDPSVTVLLGNDDVNTAGMGLKIRTANFDPTPWLRLYGLYGADAYVDWLGSAASIQFEDTGIGADQSRGQYVDDSRYATTGAFAELRVDLADVVRLRSGGRVAMADADTPGDARSETAAVDETWFAVVGMAGIAVDPVPWLTFAFNADQGFRAPNLDDLTSRQQTGPGFQFENADLDPERALTLEAGMGLDFGVFQFDAWAFRTRIDDLIGRVAVDVESCPDETPQCGASQTRFQLDNFDGKALLRGLEGSARAYLPLGLWLRGTVSFARGDRPNPFAAADSSEPERLPISRVPPLNGTAELGWRSRRGVYAAGALRWARLQDRLAPQDAADPRIPLGGTPGYRVFDLRAGYRMDPYVLFGVVFENLTDAPWRAHGSSVNGPGRSLLVETQFGF
ncbi:MAG: TonB-dependent receptor [Myxococcota bacterium]